MIPNNLSDFTKLEEVFFTSDRENLSLIIRYSKFYYISEALLPVIFEIMDRNGIDSQDDQKGGRDNA
ncbi:MAG: hypothetical protein LW716_19150 [Microcystis sp. 53602_E8]|jgi:hypothetical protein|nr:hypothetical protein [Microcystis sp. 53602_E8]